MSNRSLIVVLFVALALAVALIVAEHSDSRPDPQGRDAPSAPQSASNSSLADRLNLADGEVIGIRVTQGTNGAQRERVITDGSQWFYAQGDDPEIQPVDESRVRAFLQFLRQTQTEPIKSDSTDITNVITLTIERKKADQSLHSQAITISGAALNGRTQASQNESRFTVPDGLLKLLTEPGISAWRSSKAMPTITQAARVSIDRSGQRVYAFARSRAGWTLDEPVVALADGNLITAVLKQLDAVTVQRYLGINQPPPGVDDSKTPTATIEWKLTDASAPPSRVELFSPATAAGDIFFARVRTAADDDAKAPHYWAAIDAKPFTPVLVDPSGLVLPRLSTLNPADLGGFRITRGDKSLAFLREGSLWREQVDGNQPITLGPKEAADALALIDLITQPKATSVDLKLGQATIMGSEFFLELLSPSNTVLETYALSITSPAQTDGPSQLRLRRSIEFIYAPVPAVIQTALDRLRQ